MTNSKKKKKKICLKQFVINHCQNIRNCGCLSHFFFDKINDDYSGSNMQVGIDYKYLRFSLDYDPKVYGKYFKNKQYEYIIRDICHEMAHIATGELVDSLKIDANKKDVEYYEERVTELTSRWLYSSYQRFMEKKGINIKTGEYK